ncbi:MAG TPA: hypothetical protein VMR31_01075 [Myxococcota bacterium]|nr:hypothetical protein [Myxococcota bacterium]
MGKLLLLLVVLVVAVAIGAVANYQRNAGLDADAHLPRPYAGISTPDLTKMIQAYQAQIDRAKKRVAAEPTGASAIDRQGDSDVEGKAQAFAGFQRQNERWKEQRGEVMEYEAELKKLMFEKSIRDRHLDDPSYVFKQRLLTF